ncbi:zf-DNL-domain-containing protein [Amniculicola lignicola CBS 123094]|uniref:Zf-DNL-domain-containing protein n=1 Tax=Amniculicola lignicola CBS 123094 TaxID=1392246 RepID=A0A6A5WJ63_9PLEO|nr:zf-DNL-domain-containing protein [Amniculicola lignicola CBS 123094]
MRASPSFLRCLSRLPTPRAAPSPTRIPAASAFHTTPRTSAALLRPRLPLSRPRELFATVRHESSASKPVPPARGSTTAPDSRLEQDQVPSYDLTFTCKQCSTRSSHRVSKQGYHHGTILITCPGCKNRHMISDHLKIFSDKSVTVEDLMKENGQLVRRGSLSADGDVEFWDDGSTSPRSANYLPHEPEAASDKLSAPSTPNAPKKD